MRWNEIIAENRTAIGQTLPKGPISHFPIANTGELGHLEDALCLWVEGSCAEAQPYLMKMLPLMARFTNTAPTLYRGIVIDDGRKVLDALENGITISHQGKSMESWSDDPEKVDEFMAGWDRPWIMLTCPSSRLNVAIDLTTFNDEAHPFTEMKSQGEVIVLAEPSVFYSADQISIPGFSIDELRDYEASMGRPLDESYHQYPATLPDARAIARYISDLASDDVDEEMIEERFFGCSAVLQLVPIADIHEGNPDGNIRSKAKEKRYAKLSPDTIPPIVIENGVVMDGNHRYRVALAAGLQSLWCYVVSE